MDGLPGTAADGPADTGGDAPARTDDYYSQLRTIVLDISTSAMSAEPDEFGTKLQWGLETIGTHLDADRGYVLRQSGDEFAVDIEWTDDGVDPRTVRRVDLTDHEWLRNRLEGFQNATVPDKAFSTPSATPEFLEADGVRSAVFLPMVDDWSLIGIVGFDVSTPGHRWAPEEVTILRTAADIMTHSLARIRRERTLAEQNERLEAFASVVSHDLRNPLNVVTGSLELAQKRGDPEHIDRAIDAADRMEDLIEQMLTLAREGEDIGNTREIRLESVARQAWNAVDSQAAELRVDDLGRVEADPDRLQEAFENLFRNSVEHGGADVSVRVGVSENGFYVADDGPGITADQRESVFDRGYTDDDGTGLGLAIVRRIVDAHGWSIRAGTAADGGARFDVTILSG